MEHGHAEVICPKCVVCVRGGRQESVMFKVKEKKRKEETSARQPSENQSRYGTGHTHTERPFRRHRVERHLIDTSTGRCAGVWLIAANVSSWVRRPEPQHVLSS